MAKLEKNKKISKTPKKAPEEAKLSSKSATKTKSKNSKAEEIKKASTSKNIKNAKTTVKAKPEKTQTKTLAKTKADSKAKTKKPEKTKTEVKSKSKTKTNKSSSSENKDSKTTKAKISPKNNKPEKSNKKEVKNKKEIKNEKPVKDTSSKRGRKKKSPSENTETITKKVNVIKLKSSKLLAKKAKNKEKEIDEEEEIFDDLEDLSLGLEDEIEAIAPTKRRPGRPAKPKDQLSTKLKLIDFPSSVRLPKRPSLKPKKNLSSTIPGSALAQLLTVGDLNDNSSDTNENIENQKAAFLAPPKEELENAEEIQTLPSWTPRSWVTREGERLIIRGQELVKEEQFNNLETETPSGVISQEEVDEVIRRIRDSYKKKNLSKKGNSI